MGTLILFAAAMERDAAAPWLQFSDDMSVAIGLCGVGLVDAGIGTARLVDQHRPNLVVFLGTCGAYPGSAVSIGDLVVTSAAHLVTGDLLSGMMRLPELIPSRIEADRDLVETYSLLLGRTGTPPRLCEVATTPGITTNYDLAGLVVRGGPCTVENLEAYAVLRAAQDVPTVVLLGVTNMVSPKGGEDWRSNYPEMMKRLAMAVATEM